MGLESSNEAFDGIRQFLEEPGPVDQGIRQIALSQAVRLRGLEAAREYDEEHDLRGVERVGDLSPTLFTNLVEDATRRGYLRETIEANSAGGLPGYREAFEEAEYHVDNLLEVYPDPSVDSFHEPGDQTFVKHEKLVEISFEINRITNPPPPNASQ